MPSQFDAQCELASDDTSHLAHVLPFFSIVETTFKTVDGHPIECTVFVPKQSALSAEQLAHPRPVCVSWHGGGFVTGSRHHYTWMAVWQVELVREQAAVMVVPDYRFLPESSAHDILHDVADLLQWLPTGLPPLAGREGSTVDVSRTLLTGESAGGWCAMQAGLLHGTGVAGFAGADSPIKIAAVISKYGWIEPTFKGESPLEPEGVPRMPADLVDRHLAAVRAGTLPAVVSDALPPARFELVWAAIQHGFIASAMRGAPELSALGALGLVKALPPIWAHNGTADSVVDYRALLTFAARARELHGADVRLKETYVSGAEHGVGNNLHMGEGWVKEGLDWIKMYWP